MATDDSIESTRFERILAYMVASLVGLSLLSFLYIILASVFRYSLDNAFSSMVFMIPMIGLPVAFVLMFTLIITNIIRRRKLAK